MNETTTVTTIETLHKRVVTIHSFDDQGRHVGTDEQIDENRTVTNESDAPTWAPAFAFVAEPADGTIAKAEVDGTAPVTAECDEDIEPVVPAGDQNAPDFFAVPFGEIHDSGAVVESYTVVDDAVAPDGSGLPADVEAANGQVVDDTPAETTVDEAQPASESPDPQPVDAPVEDAPVADAGGPPVYDVAGEPLPAAIDEAVAAPPAEPAF